MTKFVGNTISIPSLATAPASPVNGDVYYDTTDNKVYARVGGAWVDLGTAGGGGGVTSVTGTAPIVSSGGATPAISVTAASTSASGVVQLSDSVSTTSSVLAATPTAVKTAYDLTNTGLASYLFGSTIVSNGEIPNAPHFVFTASQTSSSGTVYFTRIVPFRTIEVSNLSFGNNGASSGLTTARFGIYTRSGSTMTLEARTASDTTIFNSASSKVTRALDTTGGYPATYTMIAGTEYWIAVIQVGTTIASMIYNNLSSVTSGIYGNRSYTRTSMTDLPASISATGGTAFYYGAVS